VKSSIRTNIRIATALAVAAVGMTIAQAAGANSGSVGLARGILETQYGFSPSQAVSWTTGACSYKVKPSSCYLTPAEARATSVAEASSLGAYRNMTPQQAINWSTGVCSYQDKPSSCYLTPKQAAAQSQALADAMGVPQSVTWIVPSGSTSAFNWGTAGIWAAGTLGLILLLTGIGVTFTRHHREPHHA
jgi:hypothetical protein